MSAMRKLSIALVPLALLPNVWARRPLRRHLEASLDSNDNTDPSSLSLVEMLLFNELLVREDDCDGIYADWAGPSAASLGLSKTVQYDYDMFVEKDGDLNRVVAGLQNQILRDVGKDIFAGCSRRLTNDTISDIAIEEISSAPSDTVSTSSSCMIEDATNMADCYPMTGYITAYYSTSSTESGRRLDEESAVHDTIANSVKAAMDNNDQVYYLGDRETYSSQSYSLQEAKYDEKKGFVHSLWPILVGASVGVIATVGAAVWCKKRKSKKGDNEESVVIEPVKVAQEDIQEDQIETANENGLDDGDSASPETEVSKGGTCNVLGIFKCGDC